VVVSHDRHFMNAIATHVADVDYQTVTVYTGDYSDFVEQKTTGKRQGEQDIAQKKKRIAELKEFVARFGASANRSSQAQSRVKEIEKLEASMVVRRSSVVRPYVKFEHGAPLGRDVLRATGLSKRFGDKQVFKDFTFNMMRGERLAVIGPSGIGKSTLLKMLVGEYKPDAGEVIWGHETTVGYFAQDHHEALERASPPTTGSGASTRTPPSSRCARCSASCSSAARRASRRPRPSPAARRRGSCSRSSCCTKNNVLLLDEPTNHLDVESIDALLEALIAYPGTVIVTSHDRHFVSALGTRVLELSEKGPQLFNGTYEEFLAAQGTEYLRR
jgi:ATPase subunit of ABC transporter with duplicated ATPase domains